jgi:predicted Zn-dependent protease
MRRTTYSFRRLSVEERTSIGAYRINVLRYDGSVAERSISRTIPFPGYEVRYFRMINGLKNGVLPPNGSRVKTINRD